MSKLEYQELSTTVIQSPVQHVAVPQTTVRFFPPNYLIKWVGSSDLVLRMGQLFTYTGGMQIKPATSVFRVTAAEDTTNLTKINTKI